MSRMGREFSLVLLGAGVLTAGYFLAPSPDADLEQKADQQAAARVGGGSTTGRHYYHPIVWVHSPVYAGAPSGRPATAAAPVARGGFGGIGRSATVGG
jgi:hypothetical protein